MKNNNSLYRIKKQLKPVVDLVLIMFWYLLYGIYIIYIYTNNQVCPPSPGTTTFATVTSQLGEHSDWRGGCRTCWVVYVYEYICIYIYTVYVCMISIYPAQMYTWALFYHLWCILMVTLSFISEKSEAAKNTHALVLKQKNRGKTAGSWRRSWQKSWDVVGRLTAIEIQLHDWAIWGWEFLKHKDSQG